MGQAHADTQASRQADTRAHRQAGISTVLLRLVEACRTSSVFGHCVACPLLARSGQDETALADRLIRRLFPDLQARPCFPSLAG
ncbi:unnamed protein product [Protopolystoma xenopodis]|uniref:Uncharacterized protein n=1 Tax=Protopolystoma xenopodis TaxID=117903 RepID=A0A448XGC9_9PLAT|nr:unnamed protein product [Protopolystoma xenopodis]